MDANKQATNFLNNQETVKAFGGAMSGGLSGEQNLDKAVVGPMFKEGKLDKSIVEPLKVAQNAGIVNDSSMIKPPSGLPNLQAAGQMIGMGGKK